MVKRKIKKRNFCIRQFRIRQKTLHRVAVRRKLIRKRLKRIRETLSDKAKADFGDSSSDRIPKKQRVPTDFRLLDNPAECSKFFRSLLRMNYAYYTRYGDKEISLEMKDVKYVDYPATLMLSAICEELAQKGCNVGGNAPLDVNAYKFIVDSGFFNKMYDEGGRKIFKPGNSQIMVVQRGEGKIKEDDFLSFVNILDATKKHLGVAENINIDDYVAVLKEICGNSTEWGDGVRKSWTIGAKFEAGQVAFVALDLGQGILGSLNKRVEQKIKDLLSGKTNLEVLEGVFDRYYGSKSNDPNRNQGLPFIKDCNTRKIIKQLHVVSNNVVLDLSNKINDNIFSPYNKGLIGTLYYWSVDIECLTQ